jgi:hypothetical protein
VEGPPIALPGGRAPPAPPEAPPATSNPRTPPHLGGRFQAFALAPLFVWFEALFLLGYRPALQRQLKQRVGELIAEFNAQRQPLVAKQPQGSGGG